MYQKTELCVKTDRSNVTDSFSSNIGVRQGDDLRPNLFKQFINDLPEIFDQTCNPATLNSLKVNCLLYADDIVLLSETAEGLQNSLDKLSRYCKKWGMKINTEKTKSLVFNSTGRLIGSYIRSWERPGDLPRVIEMLCLFAGGAQRNERKGTKISITSGRSPGLSQQRMYLFLP
jgi:hypothetical protein